MLLAKLKQQGQRQEAGHLLAGLSGGVFCSTIDLRCIAVLSAVESCGKVLAALRARCARKTPRTSAKGLRHSTSSCLNLCFSVDPLCMRLKSRTYHESVCRQHGVSRPWWTLCRRRSVRIPWSNFRDRQYWYDEICVDFKDPGASPKSLITTTRGVMITSRHDELESVEADSMCQGSKDPLFEVREYDEILRNVEARCQLALCALFFLVGTLQL